MYGGFEVFKIYVAVLHVDISNTGDIIENLYKEYRLGLIGHGTLYKDLQSWWAKLRNLPDPNSLLFSNNNNLKNFSMIIELMILDS